MVRFRTGLDGWANILIRKNDIEQLARRQIAACDACEHQRGMTCGLCGCRLIAKTRERDANCPDSRR